MNGSGTVVEWFIGTDAGFLPKFVGTAIAWSAGITGWISFVGLLSIWLERKISAHIQCRLGPMEVGPHGALQTVADGVKLLAKEDLIPDDADRFLFGLAPILAFAGTIIGFAVVPFGPDLIVADLDIGLFYLSAVGSLEAIGIVAAGWASNNKWSLLGSVRAATQVVSYEIPLGIAFVTVTVLAGTLSMKGIVEQQNGWIWNWFLFRNPFMWIAFVIFYIASLAECKRAPFDLPEAESELVSGFHTEYSGMRFAIFFLAEYAQMYIVSAVGAVLFLGGWYTGVAPIDAAIAESGFLRNLIGFGVISSKSFLLICVQMWLRWTLPRIRLDQMMHLCLKVLLPIGMVVLLASTLWEGLMPSPEIIKDGAFTGANSWTGLGVMALLVVIGGGWVRKIVKSIPSFKAAVQS